MKKARIFLVILLTLWVGFIFAAFYIVQKPMAIQVGAGLLSILWSVALTALLLVESACLGSGLFRRYFTLLEHGERFLLGMGLGLGIFGLAGFGLAAVGMARPVAMLPILAILLAIAIWRGWLQQSKEDFFDLWRLMRAPVEKGLKWIPWLAGATLSLSLVLAFAPPADSFDALFYHLAVPAAWLRDGGLIAPQIIPHYWFPELVEGAFVWGLALGSEVTAPLLHLSWGLLTIGLIWFWAKKVWNNSIAWRSVAVLISMPSLALLAAWAYTDLALAFYCVAVLYMLWLARESTSLRHWVWSGVFCGFAMGIKYTSFIVPVVVLAWLVWSKRRHITDILVPGGIFSGLAVLVASPWYIRNWIWVGNPFYPFVFGGKYWDAFLSQQYAQAGSGIGLKIQQLLLLPFTITLGYRDANYFDGRIGPLWLLLLPACLWVLWIYRKRNKVERHAVYIPAFFGMASLGIWIIGVVNTSALWQSRLLFPALLPLAPLAALGWDALAQLDFRRFRFSFILNALIILSISASWLDFGLFVLVRDPLAVALGTTSSQAYYERFQPDYADALALVNQTPTGAKVYFLFEPRSYGMNRFVQPDPILANLAHDFYLYHTPQAILQAWRTQGYEYVLYQHAGDGLIENPEASNTLFSMLVKVSETPNTVLYLVPPP